MRRSRRPAQANPLVWMFALVGVAFLSALLLSLGSASAAGTASSANASTAKGTPPPAVPGNPNYPPILGVPCKACVPQQAYAQGIPAITVHPQSAALFTTADAEAYLKAFPPSMTVPGTPDPTVTSIQFLPASEVSKQLQGEYMGVPDSTLLALVHVSGSFQNTWISPSSASHPLVTFHTGVMVFDATTGNLLISSVG